MSKYSLAVDIGASSGRLIHGKIITEEIHRFKNGIEKQGEHFCWDIAHLFDEIIVGMKKCGDAGKIPDTIGIDTWAVDFVLVDQNGDVVGQTVAYRDDRTKGMDEHREFKNSFSTPSISFFILKKIIPTSLMKQKVCCSSPII